MAFTSSALSFMLENLNKTVIVTGSQIPLVKPRNDGIANLLGALTIAGHFDIPEVCLYFGGVLLRGNRAVKADAAALAAFESPNFGYLGRVGIKTEISWMRVSRPPTGSLALRPGFSNDITILRIFPGPFLTIENTLRPPLRGLILQSFGAGNAPDGSATFLKALRDASDRGVVIVNATQCQKGGVACGYATGRALMDAGVVPAHDMTCEAALIKLGWLLGDPANTPEDVRRLIQTNLRGELTPPAGEIQFSLLESEGFLRSVYEAVVAQTRFEGAHDRGGYNVQNRIREALMPTLLCAAAAQGNLEAVEDMLGGRCDQLLGHGTAAYHSGVTISSADYDGNTALHMASAEGRSDTVEYLLAREGVLINALDRLGRTPLRNAVECLHRGCAELLTEAGGAFGMKGGEMAARLCTLAAEDDTERLALFCAANADLDAADYDGRTALHVAYSEGNTASAEVLEEHGASVTRKDRWGRSPLDERTRYNAVQATGTFTTTASRMLGPPLPHARDRQISFDSAEELAITRLNYQQFRKGGPRGSKGELSGVARLGPQASRRSAEASSYIARLEERVRSLEIENNGLLGRLA